MSNEKRFVLFAVVMFAWLLGFPYVMRFLGLSPAPRKPPALPAAAAAAQDAQLKKPEPTPTGVLPKDSAKPAVAQGQGPAKAAPDAPPKRPEVELVNESELVLGSVTDQSAT